MGAEEQLAVPSRRDSTTRWCRPNRRAGASSTATATCSSRTWRRGPSPSTASSAKRPARGCSASSPRCSRAVHGRAARGRTSTICARSPLKPAIVALGVPEPARHRDPRAHRGLSRDAVEKLTVRHYPHGSSSPRTSSATSARSPTTSCDSDATRAIRRATRSARTAPSARTRSDLRGKPRREKVEVDPTGKPVGAPLDVDPGTIGDDVKLTIDANCAEARPRPRSRRASRPARARSRTRTSRASASRS